ncbi:uncharacterized protein LOC130950741 [Arachis stenosperma]|uniref:uncharacterized protein LOC130950741 n=1 Tax=Arachis stenosperma TaxID=217475 RepID=UPI0025AC232C|nr:uncharacterized protein LOC130950741 [Arachis stenosperma]
MEFTSSFDQTNFLGYHPPPPISNGGWEYHQENTNSEHSNPWRFASETQDEQENHMGYQPPPQNDSYHYPYGGWEYQQEMMDHEQSTQMGYAPRSHNDQESYMGYFPPPQNDSSYHTNCGWENQDQGMMGFEQSNQMGCFTRTQNDSYSYEWDNYPNCDWEGQNQGEFNVSYPIHHEPAPLNYPTSPPNFSYQNSSPLDYASTQSFLQNPYQSSHQSHNLFHTPQHNFTTIHSRHQNYSQPSSLELTDEEYLEGIEIQRKLVEFYTKSPSWEETILEQINGSLEQTKRNLEPSNSTDEDKFVGEEVEKQDEEASLSRKISMKNEVEVVEPEIALEMTREHEDSQLSQTSLDQNASTLETMIERYEEEMKKCWEDQQTSSMIELLKQMLGAKKGVEEHEREEVNPENSHSSEAENHMKERLIRPPIQEAFDEKKTPTITQPPRLGFKEVKAINKSTKKRIVTKLPRTIFMKKKGSTTSNPPPDPASKLNQAINKRKLAEERPRQGTLAEFSSPLRSFLLTNWKKRKKVNNMSTIE